MGCEIWIVPVVAIAVWIITSLLKGAEDKTDKVRRGPDGEERAQPPVELDKFLAEVRRRKQTATQRPEPPRPAPRPAPPPPRVADRPPPGQMQPTVSQRPAAPPRRKPRPAEPVSRRRVESERVPLAIPVEVIPEVIPIEPGDPGRFPRRGTSLGAADVGQAGKVHKAGLTPLQTQLAALLSSPQQLRAAFILQEVFGPPLCKRRR